MNCEELVRYLSDYIDNDLDEDLSAEAQEHLSTCHNCHIVFDTTQKTIVLSRMQSRHGIPAQRREQLYTLIASAFARRNDEPGESV
jgi:heterodisulfide reductase subunit B